MVGIISFMIKYFFAFFALILYHIIKRLLNIF